MLNNNENLKIYFIGIGGIGMSSLALYLKSRNFIVLGSDKIKTEQTNILENENIKINYESNLEDIKNSDVIIYTLALGDNDKELNYAKKLCKPIYKRSQLLGMILNYFNNSVGVSGSHGKTTITSMIANILDTSKKSFTAFIGGFDNKLSNFYTDGQKQVVVSEVCEFNRAIYDITATIGICANIDNDHLDCYQNIENVKNAFYSFLDRSDYKIICNDDKILKQYKGEKVLTYGIKNKSQVYAKNVTQLIGRYSFDLIIKNKNYGRINLKVFGKHNVYNALCAVSACYLLNIPINDIIKGITTFKGVKRRFEYIGKLYKKNIITDYAHHPTEIKSALKTAKQLFNNDLLIIFEPHTYSRTKLLFYDFVNVFENEKVCFYKTYSAREDYFYDGSSEKIAITLNKRYLESFNEVLEVIKNTKKSTVLILGAGELYDKIKAVLKNSK